MLKSIGKHSGEIIELVLKKKRKATVGKISRKRKVLSLIRYRRTQNYKF